MYDNTPLEWDDVFQVWYDPDAPESEVNLSEEEHADMVEQGYDHWLMSLAGIL